MARAPSPACCQQIKPRSQERGFFLDIDSVVSYSLGQPQREIGLYQLDRFSPASLEVSLRLGVLPNHIHVVVSMAAPSQVQTEIEESKS